jgi:hypothetical protein
MSSLLEQAIVDATALREAALKNAEAAIIEKYAPEIKSAVSALLEQDEDLEAAATEMGAAMEDEMVGGDMNSAPAAMDVDAPPAGLGGEDVCPCPEEGEQVELELTLESLEKMAQTLMINEEAKPDFLDLDKDGDKDEPMKKAAEEAEDGDSEVVEEEFVLDEADIASLVEELVVDITPQKGGWAGTPEPIMQYNLELELAHRASTEVKADNKALKKAIEELSESNTNLKKSNKTLKETVLKMKSAFDDMSTSNAKLIYTNRILSSPSLNERQKENIVEAISKAGSVDEAKVIYETLQSTGGTARRKQMPKSLSETIQRSSTTVLPRRQPKQATDTAIDRLQILAGIKHNN